MPDSAVPLITPTGCGKIGIESWPLWATRQGGRTPPDPPGTPGLT